MKQWPTWHVPLTKEQLPSWQHNARLDPSAGNNVPSHVCFEGMAWSTVTKGDHAPIRRHLLPASTAPSGEFSASMFRGVFDTRIRRLDQRGNRLANLRASADFLKLLGSWVSA
jgi:hypothetical protein